jgi:hypothetical protein
MAMMGRSTGEGDRKVTTIRTQMTAVVDDDDDVDGRTADSGRR